METPGLPSGRIRRVGSWAGLVEGDPVAVNVARQSRQRWVFVAHVRNEATGEEWVDVRGGRPGELTRRSFRPDVIYPVRARRGSRITGPSLYDAPQLSVNDPRR